MKPRIAVGTDHGGFHKKKDLVHYLAKRGFMVLDCGAYTAEASDYPIYAQRVAHAVSGGAADFGLIMCRSGNGVAIVANRFPGVRAGIAGTPETARLARAHNAANVLVIGIDHIDEAPEKLLAAWLEAEPEGGRHARRVALIGDIDRMLDSSLATHKMLQMGQSVWLVDSRDNLENGETLETMVLFRGVRGLISRARHIERAILESRGKYPERIERLRREGLEPLEAWRRLKSEDARDAADVLRPVYESSAGTDGYVGLELDSRLGSDDEQVLDRVREIMNEVDRPNVVLTVPGTSRGLRAVRKLTARGYSTLVLHLYSPEQLHQARDAYVGGLSDSLEAGLSIHDVCSFAGVSVRPLAEALYHELAERFLERQKTGAEREAESIRNRAILAWCHSLYEQFAEDFLGESFAEYARRGGGPQRLLWLDAKDEDGAEERPHFPVSDLVVPFSVSGVTVVTLHLLLATGHIERNRLVNAVPNEDRKLVDDLAADEGIDIEAFAHRLQAEALERWQAEQDSLFELLKARLGA